MQPSLHGTQCRAPQVRCYAYAAALVMMCFVLGIASDAGAYDIEDVDQVLLVREGDVDEYYIIIDADNGHVVKAEEATKNQLEHSIERTGFDGDPADIIEIATPVQTGDTHRQMLVRALRLKLLETLTTQLQAAHQELREMNEDEVTDVSYLGSAPWCTIAWNRPLMLGSQGEDVMVLQKFLNAMPGIAIAASGPGAPGEESSYFGAKTAAALSAFQEAHAEEILSPLRMAAGTGYFGALTQSWIDRYCNGSTAEETTTISLDKLNRQTTTSNCFSGETAFPQSTRANGYFAPNGLYVSIADGYFMCEAGQWQPHELDE